MATCPSCNAEITPGSRWCGVCHTNVVKPEVGKLASPGKRLMAYILDLIIPVIALMLLFGMGIHGGGSTAVALLGWLAFAIWAFVLFTRGTTPGKRMLNMYVVKEDGQHAGFFTMLLRETIGKWISGLVLSLGWIWILIDKDRQAWHDKLASTYVIG